jgi:hypothetical protein
VRNAQQKLISSHRSNFLSAASAEYLGILLPSVTQTSDKPTPAAWDWPAQGACPSMALGHFNNMFTGLCDKQNGFTPSN